MFKAKKQYLVKQLKGGELRDIKSYTTLSKAFHFAIGLRRVENLPVYVIDERTGEVFFELERGR